MSRKNFHKRLRALEQPLGPRPPEPPGPSTPLELGRRICFVFHKARHILDVGDPELGTDDSDLVECAARIHETLYPTTTKESE